MKLNNKGFTLIEVLAVVVILSVLAAIMVPSVNYIINQNKENNYENLKNSIISAAKIYLSDNRYEISINKLCSNATEKITITSINGKNLTNSKLPIKWLVDSKSLSTNSDGDIINPSNKNKKLNLDDSYVLVKYQCSNKDYTYTLEDDYLKWN